MRAKALIIPSIAVDVGFTLGIDGHSVKSWIFPSGLPVFILLSYIKQTEFFSKPY